MGSVGLRLAYQLERTLDAQVVVARRSDSQRGAGDRSLGQGRPPAARHVPSAGERARPGGARAASRPTSASGDPLGGVVADRRTRPGSVLLAPDEAGPAAGGRGRDLADRGPGAGRRGPGRADGGTGQCRPAIARALEADQHKRAATIDPLTGLHNRRGFDEAFTLITAKEGRAGVCRHRPLQEPQRHAGPSRG